jgi:hypothetical protein
MTKTCSKKQIIESISKTCDHFATKATINCPNHTNYDSDVNQVLDLNQNAIKLFENKLGLIDWQNINDRNTDINMIYNEFIIKSLIFSTLPLNIKK